MDGIEPTSVYVMSGILYLLPLILLVVVWIRVAQADSNVVVFLWRRRCITVAATLATIATIAAVCFDYSWLLHGGRMHGMVPSPGMWQTIRPFLLYSFLGSILLATIGKGKGRFAVLAWAIGMMFVNVGVGLLAMD
jgi:hypothetical protein